MSRWLDRVKSPTDWLLDKACPAIKFRVLTEVLDRPCDDPAVRAAREEAANYPPAVKVAREQRENGTWLDKILEFEPPNPSRKRGPGLVNQYLALIEYGWDRDHPIIYLSSELLKRHLNQDANTDLFELKGYVGSNEALLSVVRRDLSDIAAALLCRSGYGADADVSAVVRRMLSDLERQYPETGDPDLFLDVVEIPEDKSYRRIRPNHHIPDMFLFYVLAFHPSCLSDESARGTVRRVVRHLMRGDPIPHRLREVDGKRYLRLTDLSIGHCGIDEYRVGGLGFLLHDLELLARLGVLPEIPKAMALLDWLLASQDEEGVFRFDAELEKHVSRSQYHYFPLEDSWRGKHKKFTDLAFRLILILRTLDRTAPQV